MKKLYVMGIVALLFGSCSEEEKPVAGGSNTIEFVVSRSGTRVAESFDMGDDVGSFKLWAVQNNATLPGLNGVEVSYDEETDKWNYGSTSVTWPNNEAVQFYAYAPFDDANVIAGVTADGSTTTTTVTYTVPAEPAQQKDFLIATAESAKADGDVLLTFNHALARVEVVAKYTGEGEKVITGIKLLNLKNKGVVDLANNTWTPDDDAELTDYTAELNDADGQNDGVQVSGTEDVPIVTGDKGLMVLPQTTELGGFDATGEAIAPGKEEAFYVVATIDGANRYYKIADADNPTEGIVFKAGRKYILRLDLSTPYVFGYLRMYNPEHDWDDWDKLTHVNFAFGQIENNSGDLNLDRMESHKSWIALAQSKGIKAILSVGGGWMKEGVSFSAVILDPTSRTKLINNMVNAVNHYGLDGLDIDYEEWTGDFGGSSVVDDQRAVALEDIYKRVRAALPDKILSAAITPAWEKEPGGWGRYNCFKPSMYEHLDFVHLMIYSLTGEWGNSPVGQHASKEDFHSSINYWLESKNIPKHKLVPGVPFHGVLFESRTDPMAGATSVPYSKIVVDYPNDYRKDEISIAGDKVLYLNGIPTIKYKAEYIRDHHLGGIMIWELADDTKDESKSLLKAIDDVIRR